MIVRPAAASREMTQARPFRHARRHTALAAAAPARPPTRRSGLKSQKMVNKLLRSTTTPAGILAAFRKVYGDDVRATLELSGDGFAGTKAPSAVADLILWALEGPSKRTTPAWVSISNRPLVQHVTVVTVPGLNPQWLTTRPEDFAFLSTLPHKTLRVSRMGRRFGMTDRVLICKPAAGTKSRGKAKPTRDKNSETSASSAAAAQESRQSVGSGKAASHPFVLEARTRPLPLDEIERNVVDGASLFNDNPWLGNVSTENFVRARADHARLALAAIDCEMCKTGGSELTRISVVDATGETVYDALVKPDNQILDYCTPHSGITRDMLANIERRLEDVHADLFGVGTAGQSSPPLIGKNTVLVGHSIENDLKALQLLHGRVDTALCVPTSRTAVSKLSSFSKVAQTQIQIVKSNKEGHDSVEDAATLDSR